MRLPAKACLCRMNVIASAALSGSAAYQAASLGSKKIFVLRSIS
jgi:hypothetical protein